MSFNFEKERSVEAVVTGRVQHKQAYAESSCLLCKSLRPSFIDEHE